MDRKKAAAADTNRWAHRRKIMTLEFFRISMGVTGVIIMASFMPWTAYSFLKSHLKRKKSEYEAMLDQLGYTGCERPAYLPSLDNEYEHRDYVLPVVFASVITILCSVVLIFGSRFFNHPDLSLILNGPSIASHPKLTAEEINSLFGMMIIAFAFMGSYIWSIQYLFRRLATVDLTPGAYYGVGIRIIFSVFVSLLIYYFFTGGDIATSSKTSSAYSSPSMLALYAFFAGMFPQRALQYLQDKIHFMKLNEKKNAEPLPLQMIEGIGMFERTRFLEVGVDNAQNLAKSNFIELIIRTPFTPREIIDWIGQARLYIYFKEDIKHLRKAGIRTIFNLQLLGTDERNFDKIASLSEEVPLDKIKIVYEIIKEDPDINELKRAHERLVVCRDTNTRPPAGSTQTASTAPQPS